jgi:integrase/recombinase XerD
MLVKKDNRMSSLDDFIDAFNDYLILEKSVSQNTLLAYNRDVVQYCDFLEQEYQFKDFKKVTKATVNHYVSTLYDRNLAVSSINRKLTAIKEFSKFLFINEEVSENVASYLASPKDEKQLPEVLSLSEVDTLLNSFDTDTLIGYRNKTIIELMYSTGVRVSEAVHLKIEDIHLKMNFIQCKGKGNKERIIPIGDQAVQLLEHYLKVVRPKHNPHYDAQTLFLSANGNPLTRQDVWQMIKKHVKMCNIRENISPHKLRHSFATHLLMNKADIRYIQELLGHNDISTTQIYTHINTNNLNDVIKSYHPRNKKDVK